MREGGRRRRVSPWRHDHKEQDYVATWASPYFIKLSLRKEAVSPALKGEVQAYRALTFPSENLDLNFAAAAGSQF